MPILFILDDDKDILESLKYWFTTKDFDVYVFTNPMSMLASIQDLNPDLFLLDVYLDSQNGRTVCKQLRNEYQLNSPVVLFSAYPTSLENYQECGANAAIEKPFELPEMTRLINGLLTIQ